MLITLEELFERAIAARRDLFDALDSYKYGEHRDIIDYDEAVRLAKEISSKLEEFREMYPDYSWTASTIECEHPAGNGYG
jgi:hypothetical protein